MKPIDFPQSTKVLQKPENMFDADCKPLPVWSDGKQCVSCWRPTFKERVRILFAGKVWLGVNAGCVAGAIKEWWDSKGHGTVELMDFVFTSFGAVVALIPAFILHNLIF